MPATDQFLPATNRLLAAAYYTHNFAALITGICHQPLIMTTARTTGMIATLIVLLSACATTQRTDLYFGLSIPGGGEVTPEQWQRFSDSIVSPRFPEGYTERNATGKWQDTESRQTITEHTKVLTFIGRKNKARQTNLDTLIQAYRIQYQQQAVLRTDEKVRLRFVGISEN